MNKKGKSKTIGEKSRALQKRIVKILGGKEKDTDSIIQSLFDDGIGFSLETDSGKIEGCYKPKFADFIEDDLQDESDSMVFSWFEEDAQKLWYLTHIEEFTIGLHQFLLDVSVNSTIKFSTILSDPFGDGRDNETTSKIKNLNKKIIETHSANKVRKIKEYAGIKRGGKRKRSGFVWGDNEKTLFYETVESIPKVVSMKDNKEISIWQYAYDEYEKQGEDIILSIKVHPKFKDVSPDLLNEAFRAWSKYLEDYINIKTEDKPRLFLFRHALRILDYPFQNTFGTLERMYGDGKRLAENSNASLKIREKS